MTTQALQRWSNSTLRESIKIIDGDRGVNYPKQNEFFDSGYCLFLNTKNVPANSFAFDEKMFITQEKDSKLRKGKLTRGDFVLTTRGTVGNFAYYSDKIPFENVRINSGMVILRLDKDGKLSRDYFKFYLDSPLFKGQIKSHSTGSAQPQLPIRDLSVFKIEFPNLITQQQIADVLSVYDDLIYNNTRRMEILEQLAQAIYQEAFATINGKNAPLSDFITIYRGKSYAGDELSDTEGLPFVNLKCIDRNGGFRKSGLKRFTGKYKDTQKVIAGDIVMAVTDMTQDRRIIARAARIPTLDGGFGIISMDLVKIEPKDSNDKDYIYSLLRWSDFSNEVKNHANGANVLHLIPDRITDFKTHIASVDQQVEFGNKVKPILDLMDKLELQNENLRGSRDLLLPKLVTGEIRV